MNTRQKVLKGIDTVLFILVIVSITWAIIEIKEMLNDHRCYELSPNEFFQEKKCEKYWRYRK